MSSEENFKKTLNDKLDSKEFPFDEGAWKSASAMIDASKKSRRGMPVLWLSLMFLTLGLGSAYFISNGLQKENSLAAKFVVPKPVEPNTTGEKANHSTLPADQKINANPATAKQPVAEKPIISEPAAIKPLASGDGPAKLISGKASPEKNTRSADQQTSNAIKTDKQFVTSSVKATVQPRTESSDNAGQTDKKVSVTNPDPPVAADQPKADKSASPGEDKPTTSTSRIIENKPEIPAVTPAENKTTEPDKSVSAKPEGVAVPAVETSSATNIATPEEAVTTAPEVPATNDTIAAVAITKPDTDYVQSKSPLMSIEGGLSYLGGWKNPEGRDASGINPVAGINFFAYPIPKFSASFGLHYTTVSNLESTKYTSKITRVGRGETSQVTVFTPQRIHYIMVPIRVSYSADQKNIFGIGYNISYLLTVDSKVEKYNLDFNGTSDHRFSKAKGYTEGLNDYDMQLTLFYKRHLYRNFYLNAEYFHGLRDVKDNAFFNSNYFERNTGIRLTLVYNIFR